MNNGMLWFDNDPKLTLTKKIERAADYYNNKYGRYPSLCLAHPSMFPASDSQELKDLEENGLPGSKTKIEVRPYRPVLPGHLWVGITGAK